MEDKENVERKALQDLLSHKYFIHGNCFECGKEFAYCTNKNMRNLRSCMCSDDCYKKALKKNRERLKERHHYEVFRDSEFYYIKIDEVFEQKRNFDGKTWQLKSALERDIASDPIFLKDLKIPRLSVKAVIPENAIKIIDQVSACLYDKEHNFNSWKNLKEKKS